MRVDCSRAQFPSFSLAYAPSSCKRKKNDNKKTLPYKKPHSDAGAGAGEDDTDSDTSINSDSSSDEKLMPSIRPHEVGERVHVNMGVDSHDV